MDVAGSGADPGSPILQQLFDCSNPQAEISGLAMVTFHARRSPEAVVFHDAEGLAINAFLTQVARALVAGLSGVALIAHDLRGDATRFHHVEVGTDINVSARVATLAETAEVAARLGIADAELASVRSIARAAHADFVPSLPEPAALGRHPEQIRILAAHDRVRRVSGYLAVNHAARSAVVLHDVNPASSLAVNAYLSTVVAGHAAEAWSLAERSLKQVDEDFCRVTRCLAAESMLPVRSTSSVALRQVADGLCIEPAQLARLADRAGELRRWRSPFQSARPLQVRARRAPAGHADSMGVA